MYFIHFVLSVILVKVHFAILPVCCQIIDNQLFFRIYKSEKLFPVGEILSLSGLLLWLGQTPSAPTSALVWTPLRSSSGHVGFESLYVVRSWSLSRVQYLPGFKVAGHASSLLITFQSLWLGLVRLQSGACSPFQMIFITVTHHCPDFLHMCCKHHTWWAVRLKYWLGWLRKNTDNYILLHFMLSVFRSKLL